MVIGRHIVKLSEKNRVAFPKKMREEMGDTLILSLGFEKSIIVIAKNAWQEVTGEIEEKSLLLKEARELKRYIIGGATEVECDAQGRFVLPQYLKDFADIKGEVVVMGLGKYAEIWDKKIWDEREEELTKDIEKTAKSLIEKTNE